MDNSYKTIIVTLRHRRFTYSQIGRLLCLSRQRVQMAYEEHRTADVPPLLKAKRYGDLRDALKHVQPILFTRPGFDPHGVPGAGLVSLVREMVRRRDGYRCQMCYRKARPGERKLDVHHLDERMEGEPVSGLPDANLEPDDMITLCHQCHMRIAMARRRRPPPLVLATPR